LKAGEEPMTDAIYHNSFVYLIGWTTLDMWYIGVRYSKWCSPSELWTTYFTSSKHVRKFRTEHGEPDVVRVLKTFEDGGVARRYESRINRRLTVKSPKFLNRHDGGIGWSTYNKVICDDLRTGERVLVTREEFGAGNGTLYKSFHKDRKKSDVSIQRMRASNSGIVRCKDIHTGKIVRMTKAEWAQRDPDRYVHNSKGRKQRQAQVQSRSAATSKANTGMIPVFDATQQVFTRISKDEYWAQGQMKRYHFTASKIAKAFTCKTCSTST
jgi:hypothetical protein